jgi:phage repressor protein C with HTH and peptisase S24 domain
MLAAPSHEAFAQRLSELIKEAGSARALADAAGVSPNAVHLWLRNSEPGRDKLIAIARAAGVSLSWLVAGSGQKRGLPEGYVLVPRYEVSKDLAYAGIDYLALKADWLSQLPGTPSPEALFLFQAEDDAMAVTIERGDLVLVNTNDRDVRAGIYAIHPKNMAPTLPVMIRRVVQRADGSIEVLCDNPKYSRTIESATEFGVIGHVIWSGGLL